MTTRALGFDLRGRVACAALLSCATPAAVPAPRRRGRPDVDRSVDPCTDFDAFANGPWRAANPIPAQMSRWGRRAAARETNRRDVRDVARGALASRGLAAWKHRATPRRPLRLVHGPGDHRPRGSHAAGTVARRHRCHPRSDRPPAEHPASARPVDSGRLRGRRRPRQPRARALHRQRRPRRAGVAPAERRASGTRRAWRTSSCWRGPRTLRPGSPPSPSSGSRAASPRPRSAPRRRPTRPRPTIE